MTKQEIEAHNASDMLRGCVNRMFVTDDEIELYKVYSSAISHLNRIRDYNRNRLEYGRADPALDNEN